ncbi:SMC5-SMC6 complex localization factor protein 1 [Protopterus annectens]|uniref:SMC5-SMC6 complex localization factor protein 1 n=1 Tax=Protopterus annectens TaxID=7888 RepID=UPI001CFA122C|nr:SMC5-SMC6 complex localization factor protein 1 [Protopterus annectens]
MSQMKGCAGKRIVQITGFNKHEKEVLINLLKKMDCIFFLSDEYKDCTHLIAGKPCRNEKFLSACAAGKWILTKDYVIHSAERGNWLDETTYEWGYKTEQDSCYPVVMQSAPKRWREKLSQTGIPGAFYGWKVVLLIKSSDCRKLAVERILCAGKAVVCYQPDPLEDVTHVFTSTGTFMQDNSRKVYNAPYYPLTYVGEVLLEIVRQSDKSYVQISDNTSLSGYMMPSIQDPKDLDLEVHSVQFEKSVPCIQDDHFKAALWTYASSNQSMESRYPVACIPTFCNSGKAIQDCPRANRNLIESLLDGHFFMDAVRELFSQLPDFLPPAKLLQTLLLHIVQGFADVAFSSTFIQVLYSILRIYPPWHSPAMLKYYMNILQCPLCMGGSWSLIEVLVRACLFGGDCCHLMDADVQIIQMQTFFKALLTFFLNLFELEFTVLNRRETVNSQHLSAVSTSVLGRIFWDGNKTSRLFTKPVRILVDYIIQAIKNPKKSPNTKQSYSEMDLEAVYVVSRILGIVVEYWVLAGRIMDRYVAHQVAEDVASYFATACDDFTTKEVELLISLMLSPWLQMFVADAFFQQRFLRQSILHSTESLSLNTLVSYLTALGGMDTCEPVRVKYPKGRKMGPWPWPEPEKTLLGITGSRRSQARDLPDLPDFNQNQGSLPTIQLQKNPEGSQKSIKREQNCDSARRVSNILRVNIKGETALHRACIRNKVERLSELVSLPGTDINVKDNAGWTPLHEACNYGNTECVREILQHCLEVDLLSEVNGVTPLHDALSEGHVEIGKLLLQHGGPVLLQQRDCYGKYPLDYVTSPRLKEELFSIVQQNETMKDFHDRVDKIFHNQHTEFGSHLLCILYLNYCSVYSLPLHFVCIYGKALCSNTPQIMGLDRDKNTTTSFTEWLVRQYATDLETCVRLPEVLKQVQESLQKFTGHYTQVLLALLETIVLQITDL